MLYNSKAKIATVKILLQPPHITWLKMKNLLVHELAHVIELRWEGFRKKSHRVDASLISIDIENITDEDLSFKSKKFWKMRHKIKNFLKADALMKKRAEKVKAVKIGWAKFFNDMVNYND